MELKPAETAFHLTSLVGAFCFMHAKDSFPVSRKIVCIEKKMMKEGRIFGDLDCYIWSMECQLRNLPHVHMLMKLEQMNSYADVHMLKNTLVKTSSNKPFLEVFMHTKNPFLHLQLNYRLFNFMGLLFISFFYYLSLIVVK